MDFSALQNLYAQKASLLAEREANRFRYLGEWKNQLELSIAFILTTIFDEWPVVYPNRDLVGIQTFFVGLFQDLKKSIPMCTLSGAPYFDSTGGLVYGNPNEDVGSWVLGGVHSVSFLSSLDNWIIYPFDDGGRTPAYKLNEVLIRSHNKDATYQFISGIYDPQSGNYTNGISKASIEAYAHKYSSTPETVDAVFKLMNFYSGPTKITMIETLNKGYELFNNAVDDTLTSLNNQLDLDLAQEEVKNSVIGRYL